MNRLVYDGGERMTDKFTGGVWPTMITPFTDENKIDYPALEKSIDWYIENGSSGLFAVCQSSEMFYLTLEERVELARFTKKEAAGRVPVIASGHISDSVADQEEELNRMAESGADAIILISNRLAKKEENDEIWIERLDQMIQRLPKEIPLGFYECPYPYKRVLTPKTIEYCVKSGRFYFLKDTSCDIGNIREKLTLIKDSNLKLYNANTATLLQSVQMGAVGYSGVMANFHPDLYAWLLQNREAFPQKAEELQEILSMCALIERQLYPINAKYNMQLNGIGFALHSRSRNTDKMTETFKSEIRQLNSLSKRLSQEYSLIQS